VRFIGFAWSKAASVVVCVTLSLRVFVLLNVFFNSVAQIAKELKITPILEKLLE